MKNITSLYSLGIIFLLASLELVAQPTDTLNVGVLVYDEVELLDFAGPAEVFAAASYYTDLYYFNVYTVAKKSLAKSQGFLDITPNYSIQTPLPVISWSFPGVALTGSLKMPRRWTG